MSSWSNNSSFQAYDRLSQNAGQPRQSMANQRPENTSIDPTHTQFSDTKLQYAQQVSTSGKYARQERLTDTAGNAGMSGGDPMYAQQLACKINSPLPEISSSLKQSKKAQMRNYEEKTQHMSQNGYLSHCEGDSIDLDSTNQVSDLECKNEANNEPCAVPGTPVGFNQQTNFYEETDADSSSLSLMLNSADMSTSRSPARGQTAFFNSNYGSKSNVGLLPTEASIDQYRRNASKTKDPEALYMFAKVLIKASILAQRAQGLTVQGLPAQGVSAQGEFTNGIPAHGVPTHEFLEEARCALRKAAKCGYHDAEYLLGDAYSIGLFNTGRPDHRRALKYFEAAAKAKHADAAYRTAACYRKGWGCTADARKVVKYTEIAALNAHPVAMMEYGMYLFHGMMGEPTDINTKKKGLSWLKRATECATESSCGAPYELATIYLHGFKDILIKDEKYAVRLLYQAAALGHAKSAALLGKYYEIGDKVEPNADLSIHFYNIAAELGDPAGMMGLCSWYFVGSERLPQDYDEAFAWAERAAAQRDLRAMLSLARFYEAGVGCAKDMAKSQQWAQKAEERRRECKRRRRA